MPANTNAKIDRLDIDLTDLQMECLEVLLQEGAKGLPDFAASTGGSCSSSCASSCCDA